MRSVLLLLVAVTACAHAQTTDVDTGHQPKFGVVQIDRFTQYFVDPRTETCILMYGVPAAGWMTAVPVACAKLKRNVPEAAHLITWDDPAPVPAAAGTR